MPMAMDRGEVISSIRESCNMIAQQMMRLQPAIHKLDEANTKAACIKAAYELTIQLEIIKKQIGRLEKADDSSLL